MMHVDDEAAPSRRKRYTEPIIPGQEPGAGLECPTCGCRHFRVLSTRPGPSDSIRRRRACRHCGYRLTTTERSKDAEDLPPPADE